MTLQELQSILMRHKHLGDNTTTLEDYLKLVRNDYGENEITQVNANNKFVNRSLSAAGIQAQDDFLDDIAALTDPDADRMLFWDDSESKFDFLEPGDNLSISGTNLNASGGGTKVSIITDDVTTPADTAENTIISVSIPANTLGTADGVKVRLNITSFTMNTNGTYILRFKYGSTTVVTLTLASGTISVGKGYIDFLLFATGATNTQEAFCMIDTMQQQAAGASTPEVRYAGVGTAAEDSTGALNLIITGQAANTGPLSGQITMASGILEKIQ